MEIPCPVQYTGAVQEIDVCIYEKSAI